MMNIRRAIFLAVVFFALQAVGFAGTQTVTNCADSGAGSLRQAMTDAVAGDEIIFFITTLEAGYSTGETYPGLVTDEGTSNTWFRIMVGSNLPNISANNIYIKGLTQTWEATNTRKVEIRNGTGSTAVQGFYVAGNNCTIEGLVVNGFPVGGNVGIRISGGDYNQILNNYIGVTATGEAAKGNYHGIYVDTDAQYNEIKGNLISGNTNGIYFTSSDTNSNEVKGNYIGTDVNGTAALGNTHGVYLYAGPKYNVIGGTAEAEINVISGNSSNGVLIESMGTSTDSNRIIGNYIGTDVNGTAAIPNGNNGVNLNSGPKYNQIGGTASGEGNVISGNGSMYAGIIISGTGANSNEVKGNYIGTDKYGTAALGTQYYGVYLGSGALYNTVGGTTIEARNIIAGNSGYGIFIAGNSNKIKGNYIGTDKNGTAAIAGQSFGGMYIFSALYNIIGGTTEAERNIIAGHSSAYGIQIYGGSSNEVKGNYIGTDVNGTAVLANATGIYLTAGAAYNKIGGEVTGEGNVISGNSGNGVALGENTSVNSNEVKGNYIGTDKNGTAAVPNNVGIQFSYNASDNLIGGSTEAERNIISGNTYAGVEIYTTATCSYNRIKGNYIGVKLNGTEALYNGSGIVFRDNGGSPSIQGNIIGGSVTGEGNIISGNTSNGIHFNSSAITNSEIKGNYIGIDKNGTAALPNDIGIYLQSCSYTYIGSSDAGAGNVISGNTSGISADSGSSYSYVWRNYIGTDKNGTAQLPNYNGIVLNNSSNNTIGGTLTANERNIISGNDGNGIVVSGGSGNAIAGNYVGLAADGAALKNSSYGVVLSSSSTSTLNSNTIKYNGLGIWCLSSSTVSGTGNIISTNEGYGVNFDSGASIILTYGTIEGNSTTIAGKENKYDVSVAGTTTAQNFRYNDWNSNLGPYDPSDDRATGGWFNPMGGGRKVTDYVNYRFFTGWGSVTPEAPSGLIGTAESATSIRWTWTDNTTWEIGFAVIDPADSSIKMLASYEVTSTVEAGLLPDTSYTRVVKAYKIDSSSEASASATENTPALVGPSIVIVSPNGGEKWKTEETHPIQFTAADPDGLLPNSAKIYYSINSGESYSLIASGQPTNEPYSWTPPSTLESAHMRIRVTAQDIYYNLGTGESAANFLMDAYPPSVEVVAPNGGELVPGANGSYNIRWTASDTVGLTTTPITLRFSSNEGTTWSLVASNQPNTGPYPWTVPSINAATCRVSIEAVDQVGHAAADMSASNFTIDSTRPTVLSVSPADGATAVLASTEVTLQFSETMGRATVESAFHLGASPDVAGSFTWSSDSRTITFEPAAVLERGTTYLVTLDATAADLAGNRLASAFTSRFTVVPGGFALRLKANDTVLNSGDYIPARPTFRAEITNDVAITSSSVKMYLDGAAVSPIIVMTSDNNLTASYQPTADLADETVRTHSLSAEAMDVENSRASKEVTGLKVAATGAGVKLMSAPVTYPMTFSASRDRTALITYSLNKSADIKILLYSPSGELVWSQSYAAGSSGGQAGYNAAQFDGSTTRLANGIYLYRIVADGKFVGKGYIVVFE